MTNNSIEAAGRVIQSFREFQRLNRFIVFRGGRTISLAAIHLLIEVDACPGASIGDIADILDMPRTSVATLAESLRRRKLLSNKQSTSDKRCRQLFVTKTGSKYLVEDDLIANEHISWILSPLTADEQSALRDLFASIANGCGIKESAIRPNEHDLRKDLRRATRALRLIHANFFESGMGSAEWQVLTTILRDPRLTSISQLSRELQIPLSSATTIVKRLYEKGLIVASQSNSDKRMVRVLPAAGAASYFEQIQSRMMTRISRALEPNDVKSLERQLEIFERIVRHRDKHTESRLSS